MSSQTEEMNLYYYAVEVVRCIDGDTVDCDVDLGFGVFMRQRLRLFGIDAPEMRGDDRPFGIEAKDFIEQELRKFEKVYIRTKRDKKGKYGRYIADVIGYDAEVDTYVNVNELMVREGHAESKEY